MFLVGGSRTDSTRRPSGQNCWNSTSVTKALAMTSTENSKAIDSKFVQRGSWSDYLAICRLDHVIKHIFVVPGIVLALILRSSENGLTLRTFVFVMLSVSCSASANYVINEWLDRTFDRNHPHKSQRPCVAREMSPVLVYGEYAILAILGLLFGFISGPLTTVAAATLLICGVIYNVPPLRSKDVPFIDVLSEFNQQSDPFGFRLVNGRSKHAAAREYFVGLLDGGRLLDDD